MELDHVLVFATGPEAVAPLFPGFVLDQGMRHTGQAPATGESRSRRTTSRYLWIDDDADDADEERRSGLGFAPRCEPAAPCPFGIGLRGTVDEPDRERYVPYRVPAI